MIKKLTSKKCKGHILSLERCEVNCSIIVSNITKKRFCSEEALEIYFESTYSGGRDVECVEMLGPNKAKVTFKDATGLLIKIYIFGLQAVSILKASISDWSALNNFLWAMGCVIACLKFHLKIIVIASLRRIYTLK